MVSKSSILKTLIYGDIFNYPLKKEEIWRFLISTSSIDRTLFEKSLAEFPPGRWERKKKYYFIFGRKEIVEKRIERKEQSQNKLILARKIIKKLSHIPTVLFIGISGGLALENAREKDDIDLFVITSEGSLWSTRLFLVLLLKLMGQYRGRGKKESQKICLNMLMSEEALMFEKNRQNLYTAHEIAQLKPMFDRNNIYNKFLSANGWVGKYLPNAMEGIMNRESRIMREQKPLFIIRYSLFILESIAKIIQLLYMQRHKTTETINNRMFAFHPFEYKNYVLGEYNKRLKRYEV